MKLKREKLVNAVHTKILKVGNGAAYMIKALCVFMLMPMTVYAAGTDAETAWTTTMQTIQPWMTRIGIVLIAFGAIEFAVSQQSEDAAQKTRAARFMISGAIVIAVATQVFPMLY